MTVSAVQVEAIANRKLQLALVTSGQRHCRQRSYSALDTDDYYSGSVHAEA